jgi:hypothetical protein
VAYETVQYGDLAVCYAPDLVGGGKKYGQDYLESAARR